MNLLSKLAEVFTQERRAWLYRVVVVSAPIVAAYGLVVEAELALWLALGETLLGSGLAAANTSAKTDEEDFEGVFDEDYPDDPIE